MTNPFIPKSGEKSSEEVILEEAEQNIELNRKEEITISGVKPDTNYEVIMRRHEFPFGTAASFSFTNLFTEQELVEAYPMYETVIRDEFAKSTSEERERYLEVARQLFSGIVPDNQFKWPSINPVSPEPNWFVTDRIVQYVEQDPLQFRNMRGHCIFWNRKNRIPNYLNNATDKQVKEAAIIHLEELLTRYPDILEWDIINEPLRPTSSVEGGSPKEIVLSPEDPNTLDFYIEYIKRAHELAPQTRLYINEYNILTGALDEDGVPKIEKFIDFMQALKGRLQEEDFPLDMLGIGLQGHIWGNVPSIEELDKRLSRVTELGLPIKITEFDVKPDYFKNGYEEHAEWIEKALTVFYGCPSVKGIYIWGFYNNWRGSDLDLVDRNFNLTTAGRSYVNKVYNEWGTNVVVKSDSQGILNFRGFPGEYEIVEQG